MALTHAQPAERIDLAPLGKQLSQTPTTTLIKTRSLEVLRLVLPAGKRIDSHSVSGEITMQCLEGTIEIEARDQRVILKPATLLYLSGGDKHAVRAIDDASLLVTILLKPA